MRLYEEDASFCHVDAAISSSKYPAVLLRLLDMSSNSSLQRHHRPNSSAGSSSRIVPNLVAENDAVSGTLDPSQEQGTPMTLLHELTRNPGAAKDFADDIQEVLDQNPIGLQRTKYLPDEEVARLVTRANIHRGLGQVPEELTQYIMTSMPKTFIITVLAIHEQRRRCEAMNAFFNHGFDDECLPIENLPKICNFNWQSIRTVCGHHCDQIGVRKCDGVHSRKLNCFHHSVWSSRPFQIFYQDQWSLQLQSFDVEKFDYPKIENDRILPFLPILEPKDDKEGNFASVQHARMLTKYQNAINVRYLNRCVYLIVQLIFSQTDSTSIDVAIKTLRLVNEGGFNIDKEWQREVDAHKALYSLEEDHIVKAMAAYKQGSQYCLLFEWANGGDLRSYWDSNDHPGLSADLVREHLVQLRGLAGALDAMHHTRQARSQRASQTGRQDSVSCFRSRTSRGGPVTSKMLNTRSSAKIVDDEKGLIEEPKELPQHPRTAVAPPAALPELNIENVDDDDSETLEQTDTIEDENWRHGDIKPENTVRCRDGSTGLGTLKLADLGRAKYNEKATRHRARREWDRWRTKRYEPPDLYINRKPMSRLYDVWSLACVFFEAMIWMLYGRPALQSFAKTTRDAVRNETAFWVRSEDRKSARVSTIVNSWLDYILDEDPECSGEQDSAVKDLVKLIRKKMLVIELPKFSDRYTPGKRAGTDIILKELNKILKKAENPSYLFTSRDRSSRISLPEFVFDIPPGRSSSELNNLNRQYGNFLDIPEDSNHGRSTAQRRNTYFNDLEDMWEYENDDLFAQRAYQQNSKIYASECLPDIEDQDLCAFCREPNVLDDEVWIDREVQDLDPDCSLCILLLGRTRAAGLSHADPISLFMTEAGLIIESSESVVSNDQRLRVCRSASEHSHILSLVLR